MLRTLAHVDMDSFFVSVERLKDPSLKGKPVIVGGDPGGRAVVASASYEAREYGVHAAMPMAAARRLCPSGVFLRGDFLAYQKASLEVQIILKSFTPRVEMASIDEAYLDLTGCERIHGPPIDSAEKIIWHIRSKLELDASIGVATNKLMAKVASEKAKPRGIMLVKPGYEKEFLAPLPIEDLPGIGEKTRAKLLEFGIETIGEMAELDEELLVRTFGIMGRELHYRANGIDGRCVDLIHDRKSIGKEITFARDTTDRRYIRAVLHYLTERVCRKLRVRKRKARKVNIKIRYEDFKTVNRSCTLPYPTDIDEEIYKTGIVLMDKGITRRTGIRLIGISVSGLISKDWQLDIFEERTIARRKNVNRVTDSLRDRYGFDSILSGESIDLIPYVQGSGDPGWIG
ncbi:MAG: DNA polymerase IV [Fidelibacterota bacterium]